MCAFHSFERLDPLSNFLLRDRLIAGPRFSSFNSPLALLVSSAEEYLDFDFDILYHSSIPVDLRHSYCRHPHYHPQYHHFPALLPSENFFGAAADLIYHKNTEEEHYVRILGNGFDTLKLGLDLGFGRRFGASESKWKRAVEIKGKKIEGFDQKYKCTAESNGAFKKGVRWTVDELGNGKYAPLCRIYTFHTASVLTQDFCERGEKEKKVKRTMPRFVEIDEKTDQQVVSKRQVLPKRTGPSSKGKKKELSPEDAAMAIQKTFRDHLSRRSRTLHSLRDLAVAKSKVKEIRAFFSKFSYRHRLSKDAEERQRFSEKIIILLLTVDAIEGEDSMVRSAKRSMTRELDALLEMVDPQPYPDLGSGRSKLDLPVVSFPTEIASGLADVLRMLDQDDATKKCNLPFNICTSCDNFGCGYGYLHRVLKAGASGESLPPAAFGCLILQSVDHGWIGLDIIGFSCLYGRERPLGAKLFFLEMISISGSKHAIILQNFGFRSTQS